MISRLICRPGPADTGTYIDGVSRGFERRTVGIMKRRYVNRLQISSPFLLAAWDIHGHSANDAEADIPWRKRVQDLPNFWDVLVDEA